MRYLSVCSGIEAVTVAWQPLYSHVPSTAAFIVRRALGNSMAVPVMSWIGERIAAVHALVHSSPVTSAACREARR